MNTYKVTLTETRVYVFEVEADSKFEAEGKAYEHPCYIEIEGLSKPLDAVASYVTIEVNE